jgi:tetratricopeptide (TPR) repeat protein/TolB-like protein
VSEPSLWTRLRRARVVQVVVVYVAAASGILQLTDIVQDALLLPDWLLPTVLILLLVGAVVIAATAWVQAHPTTEVREQAGEVPTDWQVAPRDLGRALASGRLPHLTWGRAIAGGVFALALLFGGAGAYVLFTDEANPLVPSEAVASGTLPAIAVVPFSTAGPDLAVYREGMVDLLATNLDGFSGYRSISSRTVLAQWRHAGGGDAAEPTLDQALQLAQVVGARYGVVGSVVAAGPQVRLSADLYDLETRSKIGSGVIEGSADQILDLVDRLSVEVMRTLVGESAGQSATTRQRLAGLVTSSVPALKAYLEGEALFRQSRFNEARDALERAVTLDSTFALAYWRLAEVHGWSEGIASPFVRRYSIRASQLAGRLPPREAVILEASDGISRILIDPFPKLQDYIRRYPEDPEGWYLLGEYFLHLGARALGTEAETYDALAKAVELDPTFAPYYIHLLERELLRGDSAKYWTLLERFRALNPGEQQVRDAEEGWWFLRGNPVEQARALQEATARGRKDRLWGSYAYGADDLFDRFAALGASYDPRTNRATAMQIELNRGHWSALRDAVRANVAGYSPLDQAGDLVWAYWNFGLGDVAGLRERVAPARALRDTVSTCPITPLCERAIVIVGLLAAFTGDAPGRAQAQRDFDSNIARLDGLVAAGVTDTAGMDPRIRAEALHSSAILVQAAAALADERPADALRLLQNDPTRRTSFSPVHVVLQADALYALGRWREAATYYEAVLPSRFRAHARLRLGETYERLGDTEKARQNYAGFLTLWHDADPGLEPLQRARSGLARVAPDGRSLSR